MARRFRVPIYLRWADLDAYHRINNASTLRLLEEGRARGLWDVDGDEPVLMDETRGFSDMWIMVGHQIEHRSEIHYTKKPLLLEMWASRVGTTSVTLDYNVYRPVTATPPSEWQHHENAGTPDLYLRARTTLVIVEAGTFTPRPLTDTERAFWESHLDEPLALEGVGETSWASEDAPITISMRPLDPSRADRRIHQRVALRWADQDTYGHVNNVKIARLMEESRVRALWDIGSSEHEQGQGQPEPLMGSETATIVATQRIEYLRPVIYQKAELDMNIWVSRVGADDFVIEHELYPLIGDPGNREGDQRPYARGQSRMLVLDRTTMQPTPMSDEQRTAWAEYLGAPGLYR